MEESLGAVARLLDRDRLRAAASSTARLCPRGVRQRRHSAIAAPATPAARRTEAQRREGGAKREGGLAHQPAKPTETDRAHRPTEADEIAREARTLMRAPYHAGNYCSKGLVGAARDAEFQTDRSVPRAYVTRDAHVTHARW